MVDASTIARARAVRVAHEIHGRGIHLRRTGRELVGPCPVCGGADRFAVHVVKNTWLCRRCQAGGGVIDLVQHLDGVGFADAIAILTDGRRRASPPPYVTAVPPALSKAEMHRWLLIDGGNKVAAKDFSRGRRLAGSAARQGLREGRATASAEVIEGGAP